VLGGPPLLLVSAPVDCRAAWYDFRWSWLASGYGGFTWNYGPFTSFKFRCNNTSGCYFL
jgi:hypothetical protein